MTTRAYTHRVGFRMIPKLEMTAGDIDQAIYTPPVFPLRNVNIIIKRETL